MSYTSVAIPSSARQGRIARLATGVQLHRALAAALVAVAVTWVGLIATHRSTPLAVGASVALEHARSDPASARILADTHWKRYEVTPVDRQHEIVTFFSGPRAVATVTVGVHRRITILDATDLSRQHYAYGSNIANDIRVLALLSVVFVLMTAVWPLWRLRNLDVLISTSLVLSVVLFDRWMLTRMVLVSYPALAYLAIRCAWWGLGRQREEPAAIPLYDRLTLGWAPTRKIRMLRLVAFTSVLVVAIIGLTSPQVLDVGYAVMEGATAIVHGALPYGHIPDVLHGDTYPVGSYLLYVPFAWLSPVRTVWDDADFTLVIAVAAAVAVAGVLWRMAGHRTTERGDVASRTDTAGLRAAIAWLTFPPLLVTVSTGTTDVALAAMLAGALVLWRRPAWAMAALSGAAWFKLAPVAVIPLWLARLRDRTACWATVAIGLTSMAMVAAMLMLGGFGAFGQMLRAIGFQFSRSSPHTPWSLIGSVPGQQLFEAATIGLVVGAAIRIRADRALAGDRSRIAAIAAAILLGLQISANYWSFMYLVWIVPFLLVSILGVNVQAVHPTTGAGAPHRASESSSSVQTEMDPLTHPAVQPM